MSVDIFQFSKELRKLKKAVQPEAFRFIIISHNHFPIAKSLQEYLKDQFPTKKSISFLAGGKNYQDFSDEFESLESGFFFINDFQNVLSNEEFYSGLNQRRDKLAKQKVALICFIPNEKNLIRKCIFNIPDFWEFRNLVLDLTDNVIFVEKKELNYPTFLRKRYSAMDNKSIEFLKKINRIKNSPSSFPLKINLYFQFLSHLDSEENYSLGIKISDEFMNFLKKFSPNSQKELKEAKQFHNWFKHKEIRVK